MKQFFLNIKRDWMILLLATMVTGCVNLRPQEQGTDVLSHQECNYRYIPILSYTDKGSGREIGYIEALMVVEKDGVTPLKWDSEADFEEVAPLWYIDAVLADRLSTKAHMANGYDKTTVDAFCNKLVPYEVAVKKASSDLKETLIAYHNNFDDYYFYSGPSSPGERRFVGATSQGKKRSLIIKRGKNYDMTHSYCSHPVPADAIIIRVL